MQIPTQTRRAFLMTTAVAGTTLALPARAAKPAADGFTYEVTRTEQEWRDLLTQEQFMVMRESGTELPANGTLWKDYAPGEFHCRGCDLHVYSSDWRAKIDKGWVFFYHSQPNAVLMGIDVAKNTDMDDGKKRTLIEAHCRRCGSHLGHIVNVENELVHCINAASLLRDPPVV